MRLSPVLAADDLPDPELQAMRLDGEVFGLGGAWCPVDVVETPEVRARAAMTGRSERLIAERATAAWIWGDAAAPPRRAELCADVRARARVRPGDDVAVRERVLRDGDVVTIGGVRVISRERTAADLAAQPGPSLAAASSGTTTSPTGVGIP